MTVERLQAETYGQQYEYRRGSPHLSHYQLFDFLTEQLRHLLDAGMRAGLPRQVLEIGAGDGGYTEPILAGGYAVTSTEVSQASVDRLRQRFASNPNFRAVHDDEGSLGPLRGTRYSAIVCVSVLHHIPDYRSFVVQAVSEHLLPGGGFFCAQDPLWYPSVDRRTRALSRLAYYSWRLTQGNYLRGLATFWRRVRGVYDPDKPGDMVEYHVVRHGVHHSQLQAALDPYFRSVAVKGYWSSQSSFWQRVGDRLALQNTFLLSASGYKGEQAALSGEESV